MTKLTSVLFHTLMLKLYTKVQRLINIQCLQIPIINEFKDRDGNDIMMQQIQRNYDQIKADAQAIINEEMDRIKRDPELCKRLGLDDEKSSKKKE